MYQLGFDFPGSAFRIPCEQISGGRVLSSPNEFLLLLGQVSYKKPNSLRSHLCTAVCYLNVGEDLGRWELVDLALRSLTRIGASAAM